MTAFHLEHLTSPEAAAIGSLPGAIGAIPLGSIEQHGPHLPLNMDLVLARELTVRVAESVPEAVLIAPSIPGGRSDHHRAFAGTCSLPARAYADVITVQAAALARLGVGVVALISGHGGNFAFAGELAASLTGRSELRGAKVCAYDDLERFLEIMRDACRRSGIEPLETDIHAGVAETSVALFLTGEAVRPFRDATGYTAAEPGWQRVMHDKGLQALSKSGILGDPQGATADAGREIVAALVRELRAWLAASTQVESSLTGR